MKSNVGNLTVINNDIHELVLKNIRVELCLIKNAQVNLLISVKII